MNPPNVCMIYIIVSSSLISFLILFEMDIELILFQNFNNAFQYTAKRIFGHFWRI